MHCPPSAQNQSERGLSCDLSRIGNNLYWLTNGSRSSIFFLSDRDTIKGSKCELCTKSGGVDRLSLVATKKERFVILEKISTGRRTAIALELLFGKPGCRCLIPRGPYDVATFCVSFAALSIISRKFRI